MQQDFANHHLECDTVRPMDVYAVTRSQSTDADAAAICDKKQMNRKAEREILNGDTFYAGSRMNPQLRHSLPPPSQANSYLLSQTRAMLRFTSV